MDLFDQLENGIKERDQIEEESVSIENDKNSTIDSVNPFKINFEISDTFGRHFGFILLISLICFIFFISDILESFGRYGNLINIFYLPYKIIKNTNQFSNFLLTILIWVIIIEIIIQIEIKISNSKNNEGTWKCIEYMVLSSLIVIASIKSMKTYTSYNDKLMTLEPSYLSIIILMKLYSFININSYYIKSASSEQIEQYFNIETIHKKIYPFLFYPTFYYQIEFKRTSCINKSYTLLLVMKLIFTLISICSLSQQLLIPSIILSIHYIKANKLIEFTSQFLKLCIYSNILWFMFFYLIFQCILNLVAELCRFDNRHFYQDFWNCLTIEQFWRKWNIPVHTWLKQHVYIPLKANGYSHVQAKSFTFILSAIFHEYVVCCMIGEFIPWLFFVMMAQIPFLFLFPISKVGKINNLIFWILLTGSQGCSALIYSYFHYQRTGKCILTLI